MASCKDTPKKVDSTTTVAKTTIDSTKITENEAEKEQEKDAFELTEENAIDYFFNYEKKIWQFYRRII